MRAVSSAEQHVLCLYHEQLTASVESGAGVDNSVQKFWLSAKETLESGQVGREPLARAAQQSTEKRPASAGALPQRIFWVPANYEEPPLSSLVESSRVSDPARPLLGL